MIPMRESIKGAAGFPSLINYLAFVSEGVILNQDGSLMGCFYYKGPDMDSSLGNEEDHMADQMNAYFQMFGTGWSVHVDLIRIPAKSYPQTNCFDNPLSLLIEQKRKENYLEGEHFENIYALTFSYLPGITEKKGLSKIFIKNRAGIEPDNLELMINGFNKKLKEFEGYVSNKINVNRMTSAEMMVFLNCCITGENYQVPVPEVPVFLNHYLGCQELTGGMAPVVNDKHIKFITLVQFPYQNYSGILNILSQLPFEYRFTSRFLFLDPVDAQSVLSAFENKYAGMKYSITQMVAGALGNDPRNQVDGANRAVVTRIEEIKQAQQALQLGQVNFGYYTAGVVILDADPKGAQQKASFISSLLKNSGFQVIIESANILEAYLGSLPGETIKNVRKPLVSTRNLANMVPLTDVWSGLEHNPSPYFPKESAPLFIASTTGETPFRFNLHVGDVGHTLVLGPTGAGKSVFLSHIANSALRYADAQIFIFDKGYSQFALTQGVGGQFYDILGQNTDLSFCPLGRISEPAEEMWACSWIEKLVQMQGLAMDPKLRADIELAVKETSKSQSKTLSDLYLNLQNPKLKEALGPFVTVTKGNMASLLDAKEDGFKANRWQTFEISHLMNQENRLSTPVLLYLFHQIERSLDGRPTFILIDEGWLIMLHEVFMSFWIEFLRTLRKKNAAVVLATQSLSDITKSKYLDIINESCLSKVFLPNSAALDPSNRKLYESFSLNERQIEIIATAERKRQYYYTAQGLGSRLIDLTLGPAELAFYGVGVTQDKNKIIELMQEHGPLWPSFWLEQKGLRNEARQWLKIAQVGDHHV